MEKTRKGLKVGPNEARLFQGKIRPYKYLVQLSGDLRRPMFASALDAVDVVSLAGGGETVRYQPEELAGPNGLLSLQRVTLNLGPEVAQTSDGVSIAFYAAIEFSLVENRSWLQKLLKDGTLRSLGQTFAERVRAVSISRLGELHYDAAIENQALVGGMIEEQLKESVGGSPLKSDDKLGVQIISCRLRIDSPEAMKKSGTESQDKSRDFDLPNNARRMVRFLREENLNAAELKWVASRLDSLIALEKARLMSNGRATVVIAEGMNNPVNNSGFSDFLALPANDHCDDETALLASDGQVENLDKETDQDNGPDDGATSPEAA